MFFQDPFDGKIIVHCGLDLATGPKGVANKRDFVPKPSVDVEEDVRTQRAPYYVGLNGRGPASEGLG